MNIDTILKKLKRLEIKHAKDEIERELEAKALGYAFNPRSFSTAVKWRPKLQIFKSSSGKNTFDPVLMQAYSYGHWRYVDLIRGKVVFNEYRYSNTTSGHQSEMRDLLSELNIKIDLVVSMPRSLSWFRSDALISLYEELFQLQLDLSKHLAPNSRLTRLKKLKALKSSIKLARTLGASCPLKEMNAIRERVELADKSRREKKQEKAKEYRKILKERESLLDNSFVTE